MFSEEFAREVIARSALAPGAIVLDPWLGSGTTIAAAADAGLRAVGVDINPVMVTVSRGRLLDQRRATACTEQTLASVKRDRRTIPSTDPLLKWFGPRAAATIRHWEQTIRTAYPTSSHPLESGFLHTSLFEAATELARPYQSKNPTWLKQPTAESRVDDVPSKITAGIVAAIHRRHALCRQASQVFIPAITSGSSVNLAIADSTVDLVLTSPPYCTRIDYAVSTAIELSVLGFDAPAVGGLRDVTMGTSTIRQSIVTAAPAWGETCLSFLNQVKDHPSKSSFAYYYKNYLQYFSDLYRSLDEIARCTKKQGQIVIVVQDSVYKGILVDLPRIVQEMSRFLGLECTSKAGFSAIRNMRRVNSRSRTYLPNVSSTEAVLWFTKPA